MYRMGLLAVLRSKAKQGELCILLCYLRMSQSMAGETGGGGGGPGGTILPGPINSISWVGPGGTNI